MSKRTNSRFKLDRRMGENIWGREKSPVERRAYGPGQHGPTRRPKHSNFAIRLRAKQKLKGYYGDVTERQFHNLYKRAARLPGNTGANLVGLLERRLDAILYRAKLAPTIFAARQIVGHGHVLVNGRRCGTGSAILRPGDMVELKPKAQGMGIVAGAQQSTERGVPPYLAVEGAKATFLRVPAPEEIPYPVKMEPNLVVEFYSR